MTAIDWVIAGFALFVATYGFRQGFIVGILSLAGFAAGAVLGTRLGPLLLADGPRSPYAPAFGLAGAMLAGAILAAGLEGVGLRLRRSLVISSLGAVDGLLGAVLACTIGLGVIWIGAAVAAQSATDRGLRRDIQRSVILRTLNELLPPSGPLLNALARLDPLPQVKGPPPDVGAPPPSIARDPRVRAAGQSVVRVLGSACGLDIEGSGWIAAPGIVVTNAHVVAGETDTVVEVGGHPPDLHAQAIRFDPREDIAILRVSGLTAPALELPGNPPAGRPGAILGYPRNGPFDVHPARAGETQDVITQDAYGNGPLHRLLTPFRGLVRPGSSGGPMVDLRGRVATTVFAGTTGGGLPAGYGVSNSVVGLELKAAGAPTRTGPCTG